MAASGGPSRWPTLLSVVALVLAGRAEPSSAIDRDRAAGHLAAAIRFRTVSHQDPSEDDRTQFAGLRAFLARTYPKVHRSLVRELVNGEDRKSTRLNSSHDQISYAVFCLKK